MLRSYNEPAVASTYTAKIPLRETEVAIKKLKDFFERSLAEQLNLTRVSAPLFVRPESGLNDNLNGVERPVEFDVPAIAGKSCEIVHSLAKWKRMALKRYGFQLGEGLYTDMNAIRRDEELDPLHSLYVDQWDWEKVLSRNERNIDYLVDIVNNIYEVFRKTADYIQTEYPCLEIGLPEELTFITAQQLADKYPDLTPKERENVVTHEHKAVFIMGIGADLTSGEKHDGRAPDYDDWSLNGDILFWYSALNQAVEVSSMGIRVDEQAMRSQLQATGCEDRVAFSFHQQLLAGNLPYTVGGGIGQSRLCMYFLEKVHIGEVQSSVWPEDMIAQCEAGNIELL